MNAYEFAGRLREVAREVANIDHSEALEDCVPVVYRSVDGNYAKKVDSDGVVWKRRKDNLPHPLLNKTGKMKKASTGGDGALLRIQRKRVQMGIKNESIHYAWYHQFGSKYGRIPRRRYYYLNGEDRAELRRVFIAKTRSKVVRILRGR